MRTPIFTPSRTGTCTSFSWIMPSALSPRSRIPPPPAAPRGRGLGHSSPGGDCAPADGLLPDEQRNGQAYSGRVDPALGAEGVRRHEQAQARDAVADATSESERP